MTNTCGKEQTFINYFLCAPLYCAYIVAKPRPQQFTKLWHTYPHFTYGKTEAQSFSNRAKVTHLISDETESSL